jgi:hypothetical protein
LFSFETAKIFENLKSNFMKRLQLIVALMAFNYLNVIAQAVKDANVYPSNLEENMYFKGYDAKTATIKGVNFMVLCDGNNSKDKTPPFTVKLYLFQQGKDPIFVKTFEEPGIFHMGSKTYKDVDVSLAGMDIPLGTWRFGVFVNADKTINENSSDNAMLFSDPITIGSSTKNVTNPFMKKTAPEKKKSEDDFWGSDEKEEKEEKHDDD